MPELALEFRQAQTKDLLKMVGLLADDALGQARELVGFPLNQAYKDAFQAISIDPNNELIVVDQGKDDLLAVFQLTFIPSLTYVGRWRAQIEGVRVAAPWRGQGLGQKLFEWAIQRARDRGCHLLQLTTDKQRPRALAFYEQLGFRASHEGMKMKL